ncbi:hypothetical protein [Kitasatospora sp. GP82]|uniref:hypothetical protein n=1 Tax=Kitasatospora sp. GP82 TaxID=3035089 RepID=UPI002473A874|nr:hypothetical protein [Kitasatospora sp. GP82]MDH6129373.1 hypothetical protein [Kitasatospora sp. GP82]
MARALASGRIVKGQVVELEPTAEVPRGLFGEPIAKVGPDSAAARRLRTTGRPAASK